MKPNYLFSLFLLPVLLHGKPAIQLLETYCLDCHDGETQKGNFDMEALLDQGQFDGTLIFENLITGKMPPANKKQPTTIERRTLLEWLAKQQVSSEPAPFRRLNRHEFVHSLFSGQAKDCHKNQFLNHYPHPRRGQSHFFTTWREGDWKVIYQYLAKGDDRYHLYNLSSDPSESNYLAKEQPAQLHWMMQGMVRELESMDAVYPVKNGKVLAPILPDQPES